MSSLLEELFNVNKKRIGNTEVEIRRLKEVSDGSGFTYSFVVCTLAEAQAFGATQTEYRHIIDARKSGEGIGAGTGLPAFYDVSSGDWLDFTGNIIQV